MTIDITPIIKALFALFSAMITCVLVPWIKAKTTNETQIRIRSAVKVAVFAAEQIYGDGHGDAKLMYVKDALAEQGIKINTDEIEACVKEYWSKLHEGQVLNTLGEMMTYDPDEDEDDYDEDDLDGVVLPFDKDDEAAHGEDPRD